QEKVVRGDVAHERDEDTAPALFGRQRDGGRRFHFAADATEEIELPRQAETVDAALMRGVVAFGRRRCPARGVSSDAIDLRVEIRLGNTGPGSRFFDAGRGCLQVEVVSDGVPDEPL